MAGRTVSFCACLLALGLEAPAALAARVVDPASARDAIASPLVMAQDAELAALAAGGSSTPLAIRLERVAHDATLPEVAQEWLLDRGLHALVGLAPTREARATVTRLSRRAPVVYARIDPDRGERVTPLYDAGATARFVLRGWDRQAASRRARSDLSVGSIAAVARFAAQGDPGPLNPVVAGIAEAFRAAPIAQLPVQRLAIVEAVNAGRRVDELALILAERLADPALYERVVDNADESVALAAIGSASRVLDASAAFSVLKRASLRAPIASAAVLEIGRRARDDDPARQFLLDSLAEPDIGPSAAAALAALSDPALSAEIGRRLAAARNEASRRLLALALRLDAGPAARAELARFAASGAGSPHLKKELRQWLER